jgi:hypothetical protein
MAEPRRIQVSSSVVPSDGLVTRFSSDADGGLSAGRLGQAHATRAMVSKSATSTTLPRMK